MLKTISSITNALGALNYKGTWNASSNTPTLADGTGAKGDYYVVSTAGTQTFGGVQLFFGLGDWIAYNGAVWQRVEGGSDGNFANVTLTSTDAGATASPLLELYRDSASPAASDTLGEIEFNGEDSAGNKQAYGVIHASILSPTSTAEQGQLHFETATAGALTEKMIIGTTNLVINEIGAVFNVRIEGDTDANLFYTDATNSRVGVGIVTPASKLDVSGGDIRASTGNVIIATDGKGVTTGSAIGLGFGVNGSLTDMSIDSSGNTFVAGRTSTATTATGSYFFAGSGILAQGRTNGGDVQRFFCTDNGNQVGSITVSTAATAFNITSDQRLKNDLGIVTTTNVIRDTKIHDYEWKNIGVQGRGVFAQEAVLVKPDAVSKGELDGLDENGRPTNPWSVDYSKYIPDLIVYCQELERRIAALEASK